MAVDGNLYYSIIGAKRPRRVVENGSGISSLLAVAAIRKNIEQGLEATELFCIEPFPASFLEDGSFKEIRLIKRRSGEVEIEFFLSLQAGDVLFIDSTHALKSGGMYYGNTVRSCPVLPTASLCTPTIFTFPSPIHRGFTKIIGIGMNSTCYRRSSLSIADSKLYGRKTISCAPTKKK